MKGYSQKIAKAARKTDGAFSFFRRAHKKLEKANTELSVIIANARKEAEEALAQAEQAEKDMTSNAKFQDKLKGFFEN